MLSFLKFALRSDQDIDGTLLYASNRLISAGHEVKQIGIAVIHNDVEIEIAVLVISAIRKGAKEVYLQRRQLLYDTILQFIDLCKRHFLMLLSDFVRYALHFYYTRKGLIYQVNSEYPQRQVKTRC